MAPTSEWVALARQIEYGAILERFLARGVNPRLSSTWGYWTTDARGYTVHAFVIGAGWLGVAAFPAEVEIKLDVSELDPHEIDCLYLYRYDPLRSKYTPERSTDREGLPSTWELKRQLMRDYKEYRRRLLAGEET